MGFDQNGVMTSWARMFKALVCAALIGVALVATGGVTATRDVVERPLPSLPVAAVKIDPIALRINAALASMTLEQKLAALMLVHCPSTDPGAVAGCFAASGASGIILMGDNIAPDPAAVAALTSALAKPAGFAPIVAIDEEGGDVTRLPWDSLPGGAALADAPVAETTSAFAARAALLAQIGANVNFGVVADVTDDPSSFLYGRVLGHTVDTSAERVAAAVTAERPSAASTLKHFPGHGAASGNSHEVIPVDGSSLDDWRAGAARPFAAGIQADAPLVMMSHVSYPNVDSTPASLSTTWHQLLRSELGFNGVIVTDDLLMLRANGLPEFADPTTNALRALQAGNDLLLWVLPADPASVGVDLPTMCAQLAQAVRAGQLSEAGVDASLTRVFRLRAALAQ